jgi:predicted XRE-type DNA-binding protein
MPKVMKYTKGTGKVFKDLGFSDTEARIYQFRSNLMIILNIYIQAQGFTQAEAAEKLAVSKPCISNLIHAKIDLFSTGMLLDMLERAGFNIYEKIEEDVEEFIGKQPAFVHRHHESKRVST